MVCLMTENPRLIRALEILARGNQITRISNTHYRVRSQSNPEKFYTVQHSNGRWICDCLDYAFRFSDRIDISERFATSFGLTCKHCLSVTQSLRLRAQVADETIRTAIPSASLNICRFCGSKKLISVACAGKFKGIVVWTAGNGSLSITVLSVDITVPKQSARRWICISKELASET